jgi:hypothetical protein
VVHALERFCGNEGCFHNALDDEQLCKDFPVTEDAVAKCQEAWNSFESALDTLVCSVGELDKIWSPVKEQAEQSLHCKKLDTTTTIITVIDTRTRRRKRKAKVTTAPQPTTSNAIVDERTLV